MSIQTERTHLNNRRRYPESSGGTILINLLAVGLWVVILVSASWYFQPSFEGGLVRFDSYSTEIKTDMGIELAATHHVIWMNSGSLLIMALGLLIALVGIANLAYGIWRAISPR